MLAVNGALLPARRAGIVVQLGMVPNEARGINLAPLISKELQLRGAFRFNDEIDRAIELLDEDPAIESVITHELPRTRRSKPSRRPRFTVLRKGHHSL